MTGYFMIFLLVRILLPAALLLSIALRPYGLSFVYLLLFLLSPLPQVPDIKNKKSNQGIFLRIVLAISIILLLLHAVWHSVLAGFVPYGSLLRDYPLVQRIAHNLGFVSFTNIDPLMATQYLAPELVMAGTSLVVYVAVGRFTILKDEDKDKMQKMDFKFQTFPLFVSAGKYLCLFLIMFSGILWPSVTSGLYFLTFMAAATMWALDRLLEKAFAVVGRCVMVVMAAHSAVLLAYQSNYVTDLYPPEKDLARYFGLMKLVNLNETTPSYFTYQVTETHQYSSLASPIVILLTYYVLAVETRELLKPKVVFPYIDMKTHHGSTSETTPLIRKVSAAKRWSVRTNSGTRRPYQDSTGSVVVAGDDESEITAPETTLLDDIIAAVIEFFQVLVRSSYIATTITMMAWSIMYHSWLTFVFLMWANVVWLCQNQRRFMLRTSPVLVTYAMVLLIAQYIYGMQFTVDELPDKVQNFNLKQIGLGRSEDTEPFVPLLVKSLFTCMFWVTLRQRVQELRARKQAAALADVAAPLQLTVSTAASEAQKEEQHKSRVLVAIGNFLRAACARYWIYVVAIMLFVIGITGDRMTIFRILYMFLFLTFILLFQISWYWWRKMMYGFWIVVIIYSMTNLILLYVYQFDNCDNIIEKYLLINKELQHDLGLEPYYPKDLFVKLLTPTLFLIITIMQVHYFHKDFMALSDNKSRTNTYKDAESSRPSQGASTIKDDIPQLPEDERRGSPTNVSDRSTAMSSYNTNAKIAAKISKKSSLSRSYGATSIHPSVGFRSWFGERYVVGRKLLLKVIDTVFEYLDIHLGTIIFVALMLLCIFNVCAMHVPIMVIICLGLALSRRRQRACLLFISILISVYFMAKMVYQIEYIHHYNFDAHCPNPQMGPNGTINGTNYLNNAEWLGFKKTSPDVPLVVLQKWYIYLIAIFTFNSLVIYRQRAHREMRGQVEQDTKLLFPDIRREHADKDLIHCLKYLLNYGFYKFGIEITLICLIGVIGSRMDLYAVVYSGWLLVMVSARRPLLARLWGPFTIFLSVVVPLQYILAVGFLPEFCIKYPWYKPEDDEQMAQVRNFCFLPFWKPPNALKLIFDYFLLLFATLQLRVFRIEKAHGDLYPGGSNSEYIGKDWETPSFVNPVPDFLGFVGTWLDICKRMVFLGMLWVTLAIMFMTGTNRVNLFSMGYLVGSFFFLWQGTDFYLLPKESILMWWSWLLRYNVTVVVIKTLLQVPGCIFSTIMREHACWLVQLLGIGCVDKFVTGTFKMKTDLQSRVGVTNIKTSCSVPHEDIGLAWDGVCFAFLILQRRLFHSYYFYRVIDESKATTVLASRGAELIEELRQKQMVLQEEQEMTILEKIKVKMEKIKANQKKIQGVSTKDPRHHDADDDDDDEDSADDGCQSSPATSVRHEPAARGFHTPDSPASPRGFHTPLSEQSAPPSPAHTPPPPAPPAPALPPPSSHGGPPSPSSALLTSLSLDAYLEPRRISFESPPSSDLLPRAQSPEESYPVFSPPPIRRRHTVASPSLLQRTSMISQSSRSEPKSHQTSRDCPPYKPPTSHQKAVRSGDYYMFDDFDDTEELQEPKKEASDDEAPKEMGLGTLVSTVFKTDLRHALSLRRASMPAVPQRAHSATLPHTYPHETRSLARSPTAHELRDPIGGAGAARQESRMEHEDPSMIEDYAPTPENETWFDKLRRVFDTVGAFVGSFLVSLTRQLMKYSRDYRYVSRMLTLEKKVLKEKEGFGIGLREGSQMRWEPLPETLPAGRKLSEISVPEIRILAPSMERGLDASPPSRRRSPSPPSAPSAPSPASDEDSDDLTSEHESAFSLQSTESKDVSLLEERDDSMFKHDRSPLVHLIFATWYAILAHTDIVCYVMVFINQIQSATILSIPLPLMVFLWGTLTIPRPTKTFWVTLIAYTEVIVLIKSMFQFEILPWNQRVVPDNMPFTAPRIIGIERKSNYALYDLLLLLIIFLHRFMLKSLGLWKETTPEIELREDMEFPLDGNDTQMLVEGRGAEVGKKYLAAHDQIGPRHRLVDPMRHVQATIRAAMRMLSATRSDPRVVHLVHLRLQRLRSTARRHHSKRKGRPLGRAFRATDETSQREPLLQNESPSIQKLHEELDWTLTGNDDKKELQERDDEAGPSSRPDEHFKVNDDQEPIIAVTTTMENAYEHLPGMIWVSVKRYLRPTHTFFKRMTARGARVTADVYAYMFLCDFINFLVVIFGFAAFGTHQGDGGVQTYLEENKVPIPFLVMLILQFVLIVVDRALYLRKFMLGKILFQYALIIGVHIWMFFILPFITERTFNTLPPPPLWYMVKCIYLLLSAYQIRCGYPRRIIGNFLCKSYRFINMVSFRCFMAVPFVFELRTLMDWIWTDTSMTLMDWLKMEDIFANVFLLKCSRYMDDEFPATRGAKKSNVSKYLLGGTVLAFVIAIIWFPLVFFAFGNTVGEPNPPLDVTVKIRIGAFLPVYQMSAQQPEIELFTENDYNTLSNLFNTDRTAQTFLSNYIYNDVAVVSLNPNSTMKWDISPPELERFEKEVNSNNSISVKFTFVLTRVSNTAQNPPTIEDSRVQQLPAYVDGVRNPERDTLYHMLTNDSQNTVPWLNVKTLFPKFLKVFNKGTAKATHQLTLPPMENSNDPVPDWRLYRDVQLRLERTPDGSMYWRVHEKCTKDVMRTYPHDSCEMLVMYTFNDKLFPETLNFISGGGIIGLYTTFVFLASRVIRGFFSGIFTRIMFDDLPNVDRVLQLCLDIYLVREALELALEEDLFAKLVFLYRSPETMIKWSRPREDEDEQRALPPPNPPN